MPFLGNFDLPRMTPLSVVATPSDKVQINTHQQQGPLVEAQQCGFQSDVAGGDTMAGSLRCPTVGASSSSNAYLPWIVGAAIGVAVLYYIRQP